MTKRLLSIAPLAALAACATASPSGSLPRANALSARTALTSPLAILPKRAATMPLASWMEPNAKSKALLYISDFYGNVVFVFNYPELTPAGLLNGFDEPEGLCTDAKGDVWVTSALDSSIVEYAHGSKKPMQTLEDPGEAPSDCSVDPNSGDLAVANIIDNEGGAGSVSIYKNAAGTGRMYSDSAFQREFNLTYDNKGTVWVDGQSSEGQFVFASFKNGTFTNISLSGPSIDLAGGVDFVNGTITVGDQQGAGGFSIVYQTNGSAITGSTPLRGSTDVAKYIIVGKKLLGVDALAESLGFWNYPAGGKEQRAFVSGWNVPYGIVLSQ